MALSETKILCVFKIPDYKMLIRLAFDIIFKRKTSAGN